MTSVSDASSLPLTAPSLPTPEAVFSLWIEDLQANDRAFGTIRRYSSAVESFLVWYREVEQRPLLLAVLTPMTLVGYRSFLQQHRRLSASTVNGHLSALRAWCAWLTEEHYLQTNPAKRLKLVGRQEGSKRSGLEESEVNALLRQALAAYLAPRFHCDPTVKAVAAAWPRRSGTGVQPPVPLWQSQKRGRLTTSAMRQMLDVLVRDASTRGLVPPQTSAHTLRHTFARNYLAEHPGDLVGLATLLGHSSLDTTRIYSQPTIEQLATRVESLRQNAYGE